MSYQLYLTLGQTQSNAAMTINKNPSVSFVFDLNNPDYIQFIKDLSEGASLKDAEGNDMTAEQITAFLGELN